MSLPTQVTLPTAPAPVILNAPLPPAGPWLLLETVDDIGSVNGLWAVNPGGSGLTQLASGALTEGRCRSLGLAVSANNATAGISLTFACRCVKMSLVAGPSSLIH